MKIPANEEDVNLRVCDEDDDDARERYPWLYGEPNDGENDDHDEFTLTEKQREAREYERSKYFARQHLVSENGTNYHYLTELTDEHLPELDFLRYDNLFRARPADGFLKRSATTRKRRMLFGDLWLEGELLLLFSDTGTGKSALAVQIGSALAGGEAVEPFAATTAPQRVLYFDFELTDDQFAMRYSDPASGQPETEGELLFPLAFIRCSPCDEWGIPREFADRYDFLMHSIAYAVDFTKARVLIVDNITWLASTTENTSSAQRLMQMLLVMKNRLGLSILVIAHTPKMRSGRPLELRHLQGSKMLANFADSILAMGKSCSSPDLRYLKPLKQRNVPVRFDERRLPVFRLRRERRMLGFEFVDHEPEEMHLEGNLSGVALADAVRRERAIRARELADRGDSVREIAEKLGIGASSVSRYLRQEVSGSASEEKKSDKIP